MMSDELSHLDATALAGLVRKQEVTPAELVEATIERIERLNPKLNAIVCRMYAEARAAAKGPLAGPFAGVPFLLKDLIADYAGVPTTSSSKLTRDHVPTRDTELVARYKRAGLITVGKTNTPEFGLPPTTEPKLHGATHNPWDLGRTPGGSSGGSAAAVAARIVPAAHGNDGGGSIRIPASCCGIFGLKPTRGRNPLGPDLGDIMHGLVCEHVLTISVRDSAALLDATAGMDLGAPYAAPPQARPFREEVGASPGKLKIGFRTRALSPMKIHADCVDAVLDAARLCQSLGHEVEEAGIEVEGREAITQAFIAVWAGGAVATVEGLAHTAGKPVKQEDFEVLTWALYEMGRSVPMPMYQLGLMAMQKFVRAYARYYAKYDVLITPTLAEPPLLLGALDPTPEMPLAGLFRAAEWVPFTPIVNVTGMPAMSVPLYWNAAGLPIGTHFIGRFGDEATLLRLAAQLEEARPWAGRRPPVSA